tara:strand:+ start:847 stop:1062 length:216 start_codon:yes stop_codon:yes gene_type:complete
MNLSIAQKFLIFESTVTKRLFNQSKKNEKFEITISKLEQKINILTIQLEKLETNINEIGQAIIENSSKGNT